MADDHTGAQPDPPAPVLLVGGHPSRLRALEAVLAAPAFALVRAASTEAALRHLRGRDFAAVLLNLDAAGLDTARRIRAHDRARDTPLFFAAARDRPRLVAQAYGLGAADCLVGPVDPDVLGAKVAAFAGLFRRAERLRAADRAKDEFLATLGHELRGPLATLRTALQVLWLAPPEDAARRAMEMMDRQVRHLARLVDDLLDASRAGQGKLQLRRARVDLRAAVREAADAARPQAEAAGLAVAVRVPNEPLWVDADHVRLVQVLANLLTNAAKYTDPGGAVELAAVRDGAWVVTRVCDTGVGIPADLLPRVFDPFIQADRTLGRAQGGLGLGLPLVKALVELHGGTVDAKSAGPGKGSEFVVRLPAVR
jgi:signal transduction histidine kinase